MNILGRAFHGLFDAQTITAYMLGHARVYPMVRNALFL
jgi:hypothetical protein